MCYNRPRRRSITAKDAMIVVANLHNWQYYAFKLCQLWNSTFYKESLFLISSKCLCVYNNCDSHYLASIKNQSSCRDKLHAGTYEF